MRAAFFFLLGITSAILAGCGGGTSGSPVPPVDAPLPPPSGSETPLNASLFGDSIGVNTHMIFVASAYNTDFSAWAPILAASGIKHVRDGVCPTFVDFGWCHDTLAPRINQLSSAGVKFDLVTSMNDPFSYVSTYAAAMGIGSAVDAYEGPNECDAGRVCPATWRTTEGNWQQQLFALAAPDVRIVAPSMTSAGGYSALGNLAPYAQAGNIHDYAAASMPEVFMATPEHLEWAAAMTGSEPVWSTEVGYNTSPAYANDGVPQIVQERYLPRLLLEHLRLGVYRTYIYQLFDFGSDGGSNMGLLNADYTAKPAWTRLMQMIALFADSAASPRSTLTYSVAGDAGGTLDHALFQRSDGSYMLALWLAQPVYDPASHSLLPVASETLAVTLPPTTRSATLVAYGDAGAVHSVALSGSGGVFQVPVRSLVSVLEFHE